MHGAELFTQLSLLIVIATVVAFLTKRLKQPLILGYIVSGLLVGTLLPPLMHAFNMPELETGAFDIFASLGIALLLFVIGTELSITVLKKLGKVVFLTALAILVTVGTIGFAVALGFGFTGVEAIIAGLALFFSSTIIIVKILSDKKENTRLHGQIAIGVILVDDLVATLALLFVAAGKSGFNIETLGILIVKGLVVGGLLVFVATKILPKLTKTFAASQELLFLFTIAWGLGVASLFQWVGFSIEIGALFAGVSLAALPYSHEMASRLKPLRDFFIVIFFITLGAGLDLDNLTAGLVPALILSAIVLVMKPVVVMGVLSFFDYTRRTAFKTGINLSQISEFSIILVAVAAVAGMVSDQLTAIITLVALITITVSTYLMQYDNKILLWLERRLSFFRDTNAGIEEIAEKHNMFLFGYRRGGYEFIKTFRDMKKKYVVVDYDPLVIETLERQHVPFIYGDASDIELLREIGIKHARLIVSTITDFRTNVQLLRFAHRVNPRVVFICHADDYDESAELYRLGASYVMMPHYIGSERISSFIREHGTTKAAFKTYRQKNLFGLGKAALKDSDR